jgi:hypothetical protein
MIEARRTEGNQTSGGGGGGGGWGRAAGGVLVNAMTENDMERKHLLV